LRARNIKPSFFENVYLGELDYVVRLAFIGLWCLADREGRLRDNPRWIWGQLFRFDPNVDVNAILNTLDRCANESGRKNFIHRYSIGSERFIQILHFSDHQKPHFNEKASEIPPPPSIPVIEEQLPMFCNQDDTHLLPRSPDSLIPDSGLLELETCRPKAASFRRDEQEKESGGSKKVDKVKNENPYPEPKRLPKNDGAYLYPDDFEVIWATHPKGGKKLAYGYWRKLVVKERLDRDRLRRALGLYRSTCEAHNRALQDLSTFLGPEKETFREWLGRLARQDHRPPRPAPPPPPEPEMTKEELDRSRAAAREALDKIKNLSHAVSATTRPRHPGVGHKCGECILFGKDDSPCAIIPGLGETPESTACSGFKSRDVGDEKTS
jgi:hypothetical protein